MLQQGVLVCLCWVGFLTWGTAPATDASTVPLGDAINNFTLDLYKQLLVNLVDPATENIFYSPTSIVTALAMTYLGTAGTTAAEIEQVLHFINIINSGDNVHELFKVFLQQINSPTGDYILKAANRLFPDEQFASAILESFRTAITNYYGSDFQTVDFAGNTDESREIINEWVANNTEQKIKELLKSGDVYSGTALVLVNAIYFKGTWLYQFDEALTENSTFYITPTQAVLVEMMYQEINGSLYAQSEELNAGLLELPYKSPANDLSMIILLPHDQDGLAQLETGLTLANLNNAIQDLVPKDYMEVWLPKFKLKLRYDLIPPLKALGMNAIFDGADLSKLCGTCKVSGVDKVLHEAFVEVNEEGTEAAAATAVAIPKGVSKFRVDHPFVFVIRHRVSGAILFIGRITQPENFGSVTTSCLSKKKCPLSKRTGKPMKDCCGCNYMFEDPKAKMRKPMLPLKLLQILKLTGRGSECMEDCVNSYCKKILYRIPGACLSKRKCQPKSKMALKNCCGCDTMFIDPFSGRSKPVMPANLLAKLKRKGLASVCMEDCVNDYCQRKYGK